jgi:hypothetical protein
MWRVRRCDEVYIKNMEAWGSTGQTTYLNLANENPGNNCGGGTINSHYKAITSSREYLENHCDQLTWLIDRRIE